MSNNKNTTNNNNNINKTSFTDSLLSHISSSVPKLALFGTTSTTSISSSSSSTTKSLITLNTDTDSRTSLTSSSLTPNTSTNQLDNNNNNKFHDLVHEDEEEEEEEEPRSNVSHYAEWGNFGNNILDDEPEPHFRSSLPPVDRASSFAEFDPNHGDSVYRGIPTLAINPTASHTSNLHQPIDSSSYSFFPSDYEYSDINNINFDNQQAPTKDIAVKTTPIIKIRQTQNRQIPSFRTIILPKVPTNSLNLIDTSLLKDKIEYMFRI
jgi:hypothetical protein